MQCATVAEVDVAVRAFWVDGVWRRSAAADVVQCWAAFQASPFFTFYPCCEWPSSSWSLGRVRKVLRSMRESSSPGVRGICISLWRSLPDSVLSRVADLLNLIEKVGHWPEEIIHAYVAMIPKAAGGSRPQDQRPITVLDVVYRLWAKGVVLAWSPTLQGTYLGSAAMGFRAQTGPIHLAQLLTDLMVLQQRRGQQLWLASFDVEKCFPSLPWWAVFGVLARVGVGSATVGCFRSFYSQLRQRFRYGQVDGSEWSMANGLAQGCPASPDLLNEAFHRWASAQRKGVPVDGVSVASASFADDLVLAATSWEDMEFLISSYLEWCRLLGLKVNLPKTQLWRSAGVGWPVVLTMGVAPVTLYTQDTFHIVGVELGLAERPTTVKHLTPRLAKAQLTVKRLAALPVPATVAAQMWRSAVLAQALWVRTASDYFLAAQAAVWTSS